jgi:hypothetical protein
MRSSKHIERLAGGIRFRPDKKTDERILAAAEAALSKKLLTGTKPEKMRITIMTNPIIRIAAAAVVVIACLIGLSLWRTTGSGIALADVLARVEQAKAFRYRYRVTGENPNKETRRTCLISQEYGSKTTQEELDPNGGWRTVGESYLSPDRKTAIRILHKQKRYTRIEWDDVTAERMYMMSVNDPRTFLKRILACKYESMGRSTIDGIEVEGFQTTDPNFYRGIGNQGGGLIGDVNQISVRKVWVDTKTRLPVRCDSTEAQKVEEFGMYDFQWDVSVDAADFKPVIPDDYTGTVVKFPAQQTNEETAIRGLEIWVELLGKYPDPGIFNNISDADLAPTVLRLVEKSETPAAIRLKEEIKGLTEDEIRKKLVDFLTPIGGLARFYRSLDKKDQAYSGKTVTPTDADKVLMRWKVSDNEYRVIFGDLHTETISPEKLAELEKAPAK